MTPLKLSPDRSDAVSAAIRQIGREVHEATLASDTEAAKQALNAVWFAVHHAYQTVIDAENDTRREALAKLGEVA